MILCNSKTPDQVINEVLVKLIEQGGPCREEQEGRMAYRNLKGQKCPIGWLFPDDSELFESEDDISELIAKNVNLGPNGDWITKHSSVCKALQDYHDRAADSHAGKFARELLIKNGASEGLLNKFSELV